MFTLFCSVPFHVDLYTRIVWQLIFGVPTSSASMKSSREVEHHFAGELPVKNSFNTRPRIGMPAAIVSSEPANVTLMKFERCSTGVSECPQRLCVQFCSRHR